MANQWDGIILNVSEKCLGVFKAAAIQTGTMIVSKTPVKTGAAKANNNTAIGDIDRTLYPPDTTGREAIKRLEATINSVEVGQTAYFTNSLPYAIPLEFGHSDQAPNGMYRTSVARWPLTVAEVTRELKK